MCGRDEIEGLLAQGEESLRAHALLGHHGAIVCDMGLHIQEDGHCSDNDWNNVEGGRGQPICCKDSTSRDGSQHHCGNVNPFAFGRVDVRLLLVNLVGPDYSPLELPEAAFERGEIRSFQMVAAALRHLAPITLLALKNPYPNLAIANTCSIEAEVLSKVCCLPFSQVQGRLHVREAVVTPRACPKKACRLPST